MEEKSQDRQWWGNRWKRRREWWHWHEETTKYMLKSIVSHMLTLLPNAFNPESQCPPTATTILTDELELDDKGVSAPWKKHHNAGSTTNKPNESDLDMVSMGIAWIWTTELQGLTRSTFLCQFARKRVPKDHQKIPVHWAIARMMTRRWKVIPSPIQVHQQMNPRTMNSMTKT